MSAALRNLARLAGKLYRINREALIAHRERRAFLRQTPAYWETFPRDVLANARPVFFLSTGRCGTALITEALVRSPLAGCHHAPNPELVYQARLAYEAGPGDHPAVAAAVLAARFELIAEHVVRGRTYIETNSRITFFATALAGLFPQSRFVHVVRRPEAFIRSAVQRGYYEGGYADIGRIRPLGGAVAEAWPGLSAFERAAWLWNETNARIETAKQGWAADRCLSVTAEDVFSQPRCLAGIFAHCGLPVPVESDIARWIQRPVNAGAGGRPPPRFADWPAAAQAGARALLAPDLLARYGYSL